MIRKARPFMAVAGLIASSLAGCSQLLGMEDGHLVSTGGTPSGTGGSAGNTGGGSVIAPPAGGVAGESGEPNVEGGAPPTGIGGDAGAAGQPAIPTGSLCDEYCTTVMRGCAEEHAQYIDFAACQTSCADLPEGEPDARTGNSVSCRLTYAKKAPSEPYTYCTWAGPGGDGKCGSNCEGFCLIMMQTCNAQSTDQPGEYFASLAACQDTCEKLKDVGSYSATDASLQVGADHVQCRLYHVGAAIAEDDPTTHCGHAMGRSLCADPPNRL